MLQSQKMKCLVLSRYLHSDPQNSKPEGQNSGSCLPGFMAAPPWFYVWYGYVFYAGYQIKTWSLRLKSKHKIFVILNSIEMNKEN